MKKFKFDKQKIKLICTSTFLFSFIFSGTVLATDFEVNLSEEYKKWNALSIEEKEKTLMPQTNYSEVPDNILSKYEINKVPNLLDELVSGKSREKSLDNVSSVVSNSRYNIADRLNMRVEHQGITTECWAFATLKSMETNIALTSGQTELKDFSERHTDYATSRTFLDGVNENGFNREVGRGGLPISALAYLTNGQGAVLESDMPFENNEQKINLSEINKKVDTIVTDYTILPSIRKTYQKDVNGNTISVKYYDVDGKEILPAVLQNTRNIIKEHLAEKGAIASMTGGNLAQYYNNPSSPFAATAYNCNDETKIRDHAITIVGWDDNYSRNNFAEGSKPSTDGAYIVLNSYGRESFDNGYIYISYEDTFIENEMYGIQSTSKPDYDNIYQHDYYGGILQVGSTGTDLGYYGVTYERENSSEKEYLNQVGVTLAEYSKIEIYVNPRNTSMKSEDLIKVGGSESILEPGYHRINISSTELTGNEFAIVVRQTTEEHSFFFQIETNVEGTVYGLVESDNRSFISLDGISWKNLSDLNIQGVDMKKSDVCIKAFTTKNNAQTPTEPDNPDDPENNKLTSKKYKIDEEYIMNIPEATKASLLLENLNTNLTKEVYNEDETENTSEDVIIKTGMKLKLSDGNTYILIVRGDIKADGIIDLTDISKLLLHYNENRGYELSGNSLKAADMNIDGKVDIVDISQILVVYNSK